MLLFFRWRWLRTRDGAWLVAYRFWTKVFALSFALGVVSGITMSFQFGTNWPGFMETVGNIAGPLLAYEVLTAFFLEAGFLGVMLFGHGRVSERMHMMATFLVAFGTTVIAFWILALNSWMQTPAGHEVIDGVFHVRSWAEVVFNPSFPYRLTLVLLASGLTCAFLLAGLSAWQLLRGAARQSALLWVLSGMSFSGWVATVAGWYVTEIGRQPFIVHGLVRTADVAATNVSSPRIAASLAMYLTVYIALIATYVGVLKYMAEKPEDALLPDTADQAGGRAAQALAGVSAR